MNLKMLPSPNYSIHLDALIVHDVFKNLLIYQRVTEFFGVGKMPQMM